MAMMKKKVMGKPMKKAEFGTQTPGTKKKKPAKTYPIISESGDLAEALNKYEADKKAGRVPKTDAEAKKYMDNLYKKGKLGYKMGGTVKKAKNGFDLNKDGKTTFKDVLIGRGVLPKTAKKGAKIKKK